MDFSIEMNLDNDAFQNGCRAIEVARILRETANKIESTENFDLVIRDLNGNTIGHSKLID